MRFGSVLFSLHCLWHEGVMSFLCGFRKDERQQVCWRVRFSVSNSYGAYTDAGCFGKFWPKNVRHFFPDYLGSGNVTKWEYNNRFYVRCVLTGGVPGRLRRMSSTLIAKRDRATFDFLSGRAWWSHFKDASWMCDDIGRKMFNLTRRSTDGRLEPPITDRPIYPIIRRSSPENAMFRRKTHRIGVGAFLRHKSNSL